MISNRNIERSIEYVSLVNYANSTKQELKKTKSETIEGAMQNLLSKTPGAEYLMNVKIYKVDNYYSVSGDIWGIKVEKNGSNFKGFSVGTKVIYKSNNLFKGPQNAVVSALKDDNTCFIILEGETKPIEVEYKQITKIE